MPEITPEELIVNPGGSPADHWYGNVPPVAANAAEYAVPITPFGSDVVEIASGAGTGGAAATVRESGAFTDAPAESPTRTVNENAPSCVGVPESDPPDDNEMPGGSEPAETDHWYGVVPPVAESCAEYGIPTVPFANIVAGTLSGGTGAVTAMLSEAVAVLPAGFPASEVDAHPTIKAAARNAEEARLIRVMVFPIP